MHWQRVLGFALAVTPTCLRPGASFALVTHRVAAGVYLTLAVWTFVVAAARQAVDSSWFTAVMNRAPSLSVRSLTMSTSAPASGAGAGPGWS